MLCISLDLWHFANLLIIIIFDYVLLECTVLVIVSGDEQHPFNTTMQSWVHTLLDMLSGISKISQRGRTR